MKLLADKKSLTKQFQAESFVEDNTKVTDTGWNKNLDTEDIEYLESKDKLIKEAIKERLAIENRIKDNKNNFEFNQGYSEETVKKVGEDITLDNQIKALEEKKMKMN